MMKIALAFLALVFAVLVAIPVLGAPMHPARLGVSTVPIKRCKPICHVPVPSPRPKPQLPIVA